MAYKKGKRTIKKLANADHRLGLLVDEVLNHMDIGVYESDRSTKKQIQMFKRGVSQINGVTKFSMHQIVKERNEKSLAIDTFPYEKGHNSFDGSDKSKLMFYEMNWHFYRASLKLGIPIKQGYLWSFKDMPHQELV